MPIYEYECAACGKRREILQKVSDEPLRKCPDCGALELVKLISAAGFRLAGSGWYETDFKTDKRRNLAGGKDSQASDKASDKTSDRSSGKPSGKSSDKSGGSPTHKASGKHSTTNKPAADGKT